jgi:uncharacterized protein YjbI with pentapeptide repeats
MSEPTTPERPNTNDRDAWKTYWAARDMSWRTEPEIEEDRRRFLAERRAVRPEVTQGIYPFRDGHGSIKLTRADVEWLLATNESGGMRGPVDWSDEQQRAREGLDLRGADLSEEDLSQLPLTRLVAALTNEQSDRLALSRRQRRMALVRMEQIDLSGANLEGAVLARVYLSGSDLSIAHLETAVLFAAHLEDANLRRAHLEGAVIRGTYFDSATYLSEAVISNAEYGGFRVVNTRWGSTTLDRVEWTQLPRMGDERTAHQRRTPDGKPKRRAKRSTCGAVSGRYVRTANWRRRCGARDWLRMPTDLPTVRSSASVPCSCSSGVICAISVPSSCG